MAVRVYEDIKGPTHKPAVRCAICGSPSALVLKGDEFVCRTRHGRGRGDLDVLKMSMYEFRRTVPE